MPTLIQSTMYHYLAYVQMRVFNTGQNVVFEENNMPTQYLDIYILKHYNEN